MGAGTCGMGADTCGMDAGEFGQDVMLIGRDYQIYACRAALENLLETGGAHRHFANFFTTLLSWQCDSL